MPSILVTGANSGLGLDAARQLAARPDTDLWISARSQGKADAAIDTLVAGGADRSRVRSLIFDLVEPATIASAIDRLAATGVTLDGVVLNAGGLVSPVDGKLQTAGDGTTVMFAMNVGGHARLVQGLLDRDLLADGATVVFAGSEASRGIPSMRVVAPGLPSGELDDAVRAVARGEHVTGKADPMAEYALVKLIGTAWMQDLARRRPDLRALTVSPGMTTGTSGADSLPAPMRVMMKYLAMPLFKLFGSAHGVEDGAARYLQGLDDPSLDNGAFYASAWPGLTGPLTRQAPERQPLLDHEGFAAATGRFLDALTGAAPPALRAVS